MSDGVFTVITADGLRVAQSSNGVVTAFAWDWATPVPEVLSAGATRYLLGAETLGQWDGAAWAYYLPDALGPVRQTVDGAGAVTADREWSPYGVEVGGAQAGLGYAGEWQDADTGLVYLRARWYDPVVGRFTSRDLWEGNYIQPLTLNQFTYGVSNPIRYTDPSGYKGVDVYRARMLHDYALELYQNTNLLAMKKFINFTDYASSLYDDQTETTQFMVDVTAIVHGHEYDPEQGLLFFTGSGDNSSIYFVGQGKFDQPGNYDEVSHSLPYI